MHVLNYTAPIRIDKSFEMPSIPLVLTKILQVLDDDFASAKQLEELILHDPPLSARILKLSNSAFYSFRAEVKTISHAISLLGINLVKSLAIGVNLFDSFTMGMKSEATLLSRLWMHSFGAGLVAQEIWTRRSSKKDGEFAFMCGLLHDIGKVVFFKKDASRYRPLFTASKSQRDPDISHYEMDYFGMDHAGIGALLAREWGLPPELASVIRYHHSPLDSNALLASAISLADMITKVSEIGYDGDRKVDTAVAKIQSRVSMTAEECRRLMAFAVHKRKTVEGFFELSAQNG
jgi:putative nucleotidyltransferase with HDIG domain